MSSRCSRFSRATRVAGHPDSSPDTGTSPQESYSSTSAAPSTCEESEDAYAAAAAAVERPGWETHIFRHQPLPLRPGIQADASIFDYFIDEAINEQASFLGEDPEPGPAAEPSEDWVSIDDATTPSDGATHSPRQRRPVQGWSDLPRHHRGEDTAAEYVLRFDDDNAEYLSSDSDLDWENQPFDYVVPMGMRPLRELNPLETRLPNENGLTTRLLGDRSVEQLGEMYTVQYRCIHGRIVRVYNTTVDGVYQVVRTGQIMATDAGRAGTWVVREVQRAGDGTMATVEERWPRIAQVVGRAGAVVQEGVRSLPPLEQHGGLLAGRRR